MYLGFTYFAKQDSDWVSISSLISMFGFRGGLDVLYNDVQRESHCICLATMVLFYLTNL